MRCQKGIFAGRQVKMTGKSIVPFTQSDRLSFFHTLVLKGLVHDRANVCLEKLFDMKFFGILTESHPKMYKPFWKELNNK